MKILLIEDERKIADSIKQGLMQEKFIVDTAYDGTTGFDLASSEKYDCIVLDRLLPGIDGIMICQQLRSLHNHTPILMLTAKAQIMDRVEGLTIGADDYLTKPFAFEELVARIKALTRRPEHISKKIMHIANLTLDMDSYEVKMGKKIIKLSAKEFALLVYFMHHPNQTVTKEQIINHVWGYETDILPNTVEVFIGYLRAKIDKSFSQQKPLIHTVRGFGYKIGEGK